MADVPSDPNWHWDGQKWLWWNGVEWVAAEQPAAPPPAPEVPATPPAPVAPAPAAAAPPSAPVVPAPAAAAPPRGPGYGKRLIVALCVAGALVVAAIGASVVMLTKQSGTDGETTVIQTEPVSTASDPFTPAGEVGTDKKVKPVESDSSVTVPGGHAGLYGGTMKVSTCDAKKLVSFLEAHPDKAAAWAEVQGISVDEIRSFVDRLTPLILRSDTLVTNHGYVDGRATTVPAVLQAGTAVLVNDRGLPVVKCYCGNPLTAAPVDRGPVIYTGPTWPGWRPTSVTVIQTNVTIIDDFTVINIINNKPFDRPAGTDGSQDTPTTMPTATPTPTGPSPSATGSGDEAYDILRRAAGECSKELGGGGLTELDKDPGRFNVTTTPAAGPDLYKVSIKDSEDGNVYSWTVNVATGKLTPANQLASEVADFCTSLG
ncbi:MAG: DUF6777 domain-containing protein [Candidatus Nanopelagicales bacterium]|nr:hypothetical protein [Candidatus Nanopelagicales bacterium]MDZ4249895.1 DUF6777 domain-containing protein [Candidatus Nanopelagicales bacterium]